MLRRFNRRSRSAVSEMGNGSARFNRLVEPLEERRLLSGAVTSAFHPGYTSLQPSDTVGGFTPSQIATAYGVRGLTFGNGVAGNGAGQTIAIVDAYNDPNIVSDLGVFDSNYGLPAPPSFKIVNQTGGSKLPSSSGLAAANWDGEISLDVEWAHALAPAANILLVEANSPNPNPNTAAPDDLLAAVKYAESVPGVSVVSMSWGGAEFYGVTFGEFTSESIFDPTFLTPAGHQGITFIASAGDSGSIAGVQWPAVSPNVLSVGGTSLYTTGSSGTYSHESSWDGTNGGYSANETEPFFQNAVQHIGVRSVPDVSMIADPFTGVEVFDSIPYLGQVGWQVVGGTSASAPMWAALIAIADQGRVTSGKGTLDGATQTLPMLYSLYSPPGTSGYSNYTNYFNDVVDNTPSTPTSPADPLQFLLSPVMNSAAPGYDTATGLGTPKAVALIGALAQTTTTTTPTPTAAPTSTVPALELASPLSASFVKYQSSVIGGEAGMIKLLLTNISFNSYSGALSIDIFASPTSTVPTGALPVATLSIPSIRLAARASRQIRLRFTWPSTGMAAGSYYLVGSVNSILTHTTFAAPVSSTTVSYAQPFVDLSASFANSTGITVNPGQGDTAAVIIKNLGNVIANGSIDLSLYASKSPNLDTSVDTQLTTLSRRILLRPRHSETFRIRFTAPTDAAGTYYLAASLTASTTMPDSDLANNIASIPTLAG